MANRPETILWDVAQLGAGKPQVAQPFSGAYSNRRLASDFEGWLDQVVRELGLSWSSPDGMRVFFQKGSVQVAELSKRGSRWQIRYRANGSVRNYPARSLDEVKDWLRQEVKSLGIRAAAIRLASSTENQSLKAALLKELTE